MSPEFLDYLDLVEPRRQQDFLPSGVAENQGRPLLFFINEIRITQIPENNDIHLSNLRRILACRGDRAFLARVRPGELLVTPVSLTDRQPTWRLYKAGTPEALTFFSRLALGLYDDEERPDDADFVFKEMFNLLSAGAERIAHRIGKSDTLSLVGRALFFRFLRDRQIITDEDVKRIAPSANNILECFDDAKNAFHTCQWLDQTFNGDFLPLTNGGNKAFFDYIAERSRTVFAHLKAIVQGLEPVGAEDYQGRLSLKWSDFDFAHIPIGLLSQVYEAFCWKWDTSAKAISIHYTPRNVAATLTDEAFDGLPKPAECQVLDPACGAGVFLVLAFRRLYREKWKADKERPDTKAIREILERQLVGFDISDSALKLSALSLYLTAIELDPKPVPPEKLKFKKLKDLVLFNHRQQEDPETGPVIGSLGNHVGSQFDGRFNLILSNPPWTSLSRKEGKLASEFNSISQKIIAKKDDAIAKNYENPDSVPDLPFLWKATEWCHQNGRIAMALPARTLFKQGDISKRARHALFSLIEITGIINCSNLRKTNVWHNMDQPFMLLFARNRRPKTTHTVQLISPHTDLNLNCIGEMRIDANSSQFIEIDDTFENIWAWKALTVGTSLDVEVIRKLKRAGNYSLEDYWESVLNLTSSNGYKVGADQPQRSARLLHGLPNLNSTDRFRFKVDTDQLASFGKSTLCRPRIRPNAPDKLCVYRGPLVLVKEALSPNREDGWALICFDDVAYNQSFYGYSAKGHPDADLLARYLHLFVHSQVWLHYALLTSAKLGVERPNLYKSDLDQCPVVPLDKLSSQQVTDLRSLSRRLLSQDTDVFPEIDNYFADIYGLDKLDLEVIRDTLEVRNPNDELGKRASMPPTTSECENFRRRLESILRPFLKVLGKNLQISIWKPNEHSQFQTSLFDAIVINEPSGSAVEIDVVFRERIMPLANQTGSTRIVIDMPGHLIIGLLRHYRYWTQSQARLLGAEIIRRHMKAFEG